MAQVNERLPDPDTIKMFMGQISKTLEEDTLKQYLSDYGQVFDTRIIRDKATGKSKGFILILNI